MTDAGDPPTAVETAAPPPGSASRSGVAVPSPAARGGHGSWLPTWGLITTKLLEIRRRRGLMVVVFVMTVGLPFVVLGIRLLFHLFDPKSYGPAGSPTVFAGLCNPMAEFGFIISAVVGATAGTTDLSEGVFRHLVITGRSRLALYLARIPAGLAILLPLVAVAFTSVCLVTAYAGTPQPAAVSVNGLSVPLGLDKAELESWLLHHPGEAQIAFRGAPPVANGSRTIDRFIELKIDAIYGVYLSDEPGQLNPPANEMAKIGAWIELEVLVGFLVGLGLGSLIGQRTVSTVLMIVLEIIVTPIMASVTIPYFLDGQRLLVGVALDQLRPAGLSSVFAGGPGGRRTLFGGRAVLGIPPMPTWAMITVIVGWIVGWTVIGAWRMMTRDA